MIPCIESGADDYLVKPVDFALLKARVNASLERIRLREREFGQFFSPEIARIVMRNPEIVREGRDADVTVLFCDIRGFSRISEHLAPADTVRWLSDVMDLINTLGCLDSREKTVLYLKYYADLPQTEIGRRLGISQMHVSRVQRNALSKLRQDLVR